METRAANRVDDGSAAALRAAAPLLRACADAATDGYFAKVGSGDAGGPVRAWLTPDELERSRRDHRDHLRLLIEPATTDAMLAEHGYRAGRAHAFTGTAASWFADAVGEFLESVDDCLADWSTPAARAAVRSVTGRRAVSDLRAHLRGYQEVDNAAATAAVEVRDAARGATTVTDLVRAVLDTLAAMPGFAVGYFGRPSGDGVFEFEIAAGESVEAFIGDVTRGGDYVLSTSDPTPSGLGPVGRAWRSGNIVRSDAYLTDPGTAAWHHIGEKYELRSNAAVPLLDAQGQPVALLSLYAHWPGYFAQPSRARLLEQVRQLCETALARLQTAQHAATAVTTYAQRSRYRDLLRRERVALVYQPIIDLQDGRVVKWEGLARLAGDDRLITPAEFLPSFGEDDLIRLFAIGLDQVLATLTDWERHGLHTRASINLPVVSTAGDWYADTVRRALARSGIDPPRLTLEILETGPFGVDPVGYRHGLEQVHDLGVRLAEDDLGSAYSSLLRMRQICFDEVKIDQELVRDAESNPHQALGFIQPLTSLAHNLGMAVTVEGLETRGLIEAATVLGADHGQGFAISAPIPAAAAPTWAAARRPVPGRAGARTSLGGLAGHLAWEGRMIISSDGRARRRGPDATPCPLTDYLAGLDADTDAAERLHQSLHRLALDALGSHQHRRAWTGLASLVHAAATQCG